MVAELYERLVKDKPVVDSGEQVVGKESLVVSRLSSAVYRLVLLSAIGLWLTAFSLDPYYMGVTA